MKESRHTLHRLLTDLQNTVGKHRKESHIYESFLSMSTHKVAVALRTQAHSNGATQKLRVGIYLVKSFGSFLLGETSLPLKKIEQKEKINS